MKYYPVNLDVNNKKCLVVGGGSVGARKASTLLECGALTTVVSPQFSPEFETLEKKGAVLLKREYSGTDLKGVFLVIGATDNALLNSRISSDAHEREILCNIADQPDKSTFILPSTVKRGDLVIAISTSGKSPAFAKKMRKEMEKKYGPEYGEFLALMGKVREKLLKESHAPEQHRLIFSQLIEKGLLSRIKHKNYAGVNRILLEVLGKDYRYENLKAGENNELKRD